MDNKTDPSHTELLLELEQTKARVAELEQLLTQKEEEAKVLQHNELRWRRALSIETIGVIFFKTDGTITWANDTFLGWSGYSHEELEQGLVRWEQMTPPEYLPASLRAVEEFTTKGQTTPYEKEYLHKDGSRWWALFAATRLSQEEGVEFIQNITQRKQTEEALREVEEKYRAELERQVREQTTQLMENHNLLQATLDSSMDMLQVFEAVRNHDGQIIDFRWILNNHASEKFYGNVIGKRLLEYNPGVIEEGIFDTFKRVVETGVSDQSERHYVHEQFNGFFLQSTVKLGDGVATTTADITALKETEQENLRLKDELARRAEEQFRLFVRASSDTLYKMSPDWSQMLVLEGKDLLTDTTDPGTPWLERYIPAEDRPQVTAAIEEAIRHKAIFELEHRVLRRDGTVGWIFSRAIPLLDQPGRIVEWLGAASDITERKEAEIALRLSEMRLRLAMRLAHLASFEVDIATGLAVFDDNVAYLYGLEPDEAEKRPYDWWQLVQAWLRPADAERHRDKLMATMRGEGDLHNVLLVRNPASAEENWIEAYGTLVRDEAGCPRRVVGIMLNITERKRAEEALRESEAKYRRLFETIDEGFALCQLLRDHDGQVSDYRVLEINPAYERHTGTTTAEIVGRLRSEFDPRRNDRTLELCARVVDSGKPVRFEYFNEGLKNWFSVGLFSHLGDQFAAVFTNITERKLAEAKVRESEEKYRTLFETMNQGFGIAEIIVDEAGRAADYRMLEINPQFEQLTGQTREQFLSGQTVREVAPELEEEWYEFYGTVGLTGQPAHREIHAAKWNRWFEVSAYRTGRPEQHRVAILYSEITERKRAEAALRQSEERFRTVANLVPDLLWDSEPDGATNWYNQRWLEYTGQSFDEAIGWGWVEAIHPEDRERSAQRYQEVVARGEPLQQEHRIRRYDGVYRWFVVSTLPLKDEQGQVVKVYGAATDIHEQRLAREELEQLVVQRTAQLEEANVILGEERHRLKELSSRLLQIQESERRYLARELHDEIGQYLTGLKFLLETLPHRRGQEQLAQLASTLKQVNELTERVRELSLNLRPTLLDDMGLVEALVSHFQRYRKQTGIEVEFLQQGLRERLASEVETVVYRVVQEALTNIARHAQISKVLVQLIGDGQLTVLIQDEGQGFELEQVLASHNSTGLSAMRERVELVGGQFTLETEPGYGTTILLEIPLEQNEIERSDQLRPERFQPDELE
jgi:PAS domain S-box-containing protein